MGKFWTAGFSCMLWNNEKDEVAGIYLVGAMGKPVTMLDGGADATNAYLNSAT